MRRLVLPVVFAAFAVLAFRADLHAAARAISFRASDGRTINALINEAAQRPAPAVVLVPMLGRPKEDWQAAAQRLAEANITALMIDLPGQVMPDDPKVAAGWSDEIRAALTFLEGRPETRSGALGVAGASLGGNLAALAAAGDPRVRTLALISPSLDYRGVRIEAAMRQYGARPALLIASHQDPYAARSARELADKPPGIRELQWSDLAAHGTALLSREPDLVRALVEWFQRTLG
jgi:alpha-beta hydrolase superfamily lysophospholipase